MVCAVTEQRLPRRLQSASKLVDTSCLKSPICVEYHSCFTTLLVNEKTPPSTIQCCLYLAKSSILFFVCFVLLYSVSFLGGGEGGGGRGDVGK